MPFCCFLIVYLWSTDEIIGLSGKTCRGLGLKNDSAPPTNFNILFRNLKGENEVQTGITRIAAHNDAIWSKMFRYSIFRTLKNSSLYLIFVVNILRFLKTEFSEQ